MKKILGLILCVLLVGSVAYSETIVDGVQKLIAPVITSPVIIGGTIDNTVIGATTPAAVSATTVTIAASATPGISGKSSAQADPTETTFNFYANPTTTTDDGVIADFYWRLLGAGGTPGTMATVMQFDGSVEQLNITGTLNVSGFNIHSMTTGITATNPGAQGDNVLTTSYNHVTTVGTADDAVTLPTAVAGLEVNALNDGANQLEVWPSSGDDCGSGADTACVIPAGSAVTYVAIDATTWKIW